VRSCVGFILADTEDWPAPLCPEHTPMKLLEELEAFQRNARLRKPFPDYVTPVEFDEAGRVVERKGGK
jgi:hypothetical protein